MSPQRHKVLTSTLLSSKHFNKTALKESEVGASDSGLYQQEQTILTLSELLKENGKNFIFIVQ